MHRSFAGVLVLLLVLAGCRPAEQKEPRPEKKEGPRPEKKEEAPKGAKDFFLIGPTERTTIKRGQAEKVTISLKEPAEVDYDIRLQFFKVPEGIKVEPDKPVLKAGEQQTTVTLRATEDAPTVESRIEVLAVPGKEGIESKRLQFPVQIKGE